MDSDPDENLIKGAMIALAEEVIVLADHTKLGHQALLSYAPLSAVDTFITDSQADPTYVARLEQAGIRVLVAPQPERNDGQRPRRRQGGA
jgi:DeoR family fructose operon transcriptional repressor